MQRPKCQFGNKEIAKFCEECGAKLIRSCPSCGQEVGPQANKFWLQCGQPLKEPKQTLPLYYNTPHSYTPKHLADKILTARSSMEGERKTVTVLFADVADCTSVSEKLDPGEVHQIMNGCFKTVLDETHAHDGTISQFTGGGVMAFFGALIAFSRRERRNHERA
jgi:hypothetical protein